MTKTEMFRKAHRTAKVTVGVIKVSYREAFARALRAAWSDAHRAGKMVGPKGRVAQIETAARAAIARDGATDKQMAYLTSLARRVPAIVAATWIKPGMTKAEASRAINNLSAMASY